MDSAIFSGDSTNWAEEDVKSGSRNGFLEDGRGGGSSKGERGSGEARLLGDAARLRKGLLDERFSDKPADAPVVACWRGGWPMSRANGRQLARDKRLIAGGNDDDARHCETGPTQMEQTGNPAKRNGRGLGPLAQGRGWDMTFQTAIARRDDTWQWME